MSLYQNIYIFLSYYNLIDVCSQLVSGSSGSEQRDESENAPEADAGKSTDGYTEGIPGPVTRLFVLANRGLANLIQDLILVGVENNAFSKLCIFNFVI